MPGRRLAVRGTHPQVPAHLSHQPLGLLHFIPGKRLEVLLPQHLDGAVSRPLWVGRIIVILPIEPLIPATTTLTLAHLRTQFFALFARRVKMLSQPLPLGRRKPHLPLITLCCPRCLIRLLILPVSHVPVIQEQLVKHRLLFVLSKQTAFERIIKIFFICYFNIAQRLGQVEHLARLYIDTGLPKNTPKFGQPVEQALTALEFYWPQRFSSEVIAIFLRLPLYAHTQATPCAFLIVLYSSLPPTFSTSSWYFSRAPSVSRTGPSTSSI